MKQKNDRSILLNQQPSNFDNTTSLSDINFIHHDSMLFGMNVYEIKNLSPKILEHVIKHPGHYTVKLPPTDSKKCLHDYGFYYCDTLIEPYCSEDKFIYHENQIIYFTLENDIQRLLDICRHAFAYGRFHRDFNMATEHAEQRYVYWLSQLQAAQKVYSLHYNLELAGFIAVVENKLVLHALNQKYRGKGLAKFFWSKLCAELYDSGYTELISSISAANLAAVNLYASLGFRFRNPLDVYHRIVNEN